MEEHLRPFMIRGPGAESPHAVAVMVPKRSVGRQLLHKERTRQVIYDLKVPLPPPAEQHRILAKIDEVMAVFAMSWSRSRRAKAGCSRC